MISTQQSPPTSPHSAPISPINAKEGFSNDSKPRLIEGRGTERPWKQAQQRHHRSHTVKYNKKKQDRKATSEPSQPAPSLISGPTGFKKADPEELYRQLINGKRLLNLTVKLLLTSKRPFGNRVYRLLNLS